MKRWIKPSLARYRFIQDLLDGQGIDVIGEELLGEVAGGHSCPYIFDTGSAVD